MQLSYRKSAPHCRLLEAFEGFGCRSSSLPATIRHQCKRIDETWRVLSLMRTMQVLLKNALLALSMPRSYGIFALPRRTLARVAAAATPSRNLYLTHRRQTAAEHNLSCLPGIRDSSTIASKRAPRMSACQSSESCDHRGFSHLHSTALSQQQHPCRPTNALHERSSYQVVMLTNGCESRDTT